MKNRAQKATPKGDTTQARRQSKRRAELQAAALRDGFTDKVIRGRMVKAWSQAITAWKNGESILVKKS
jgi:hypothetical protein